MRQVIEGYVWSPVAVGLSTASTWRLERRNAPALYLKIDRDMVRDELSHESAVLQWLDGRLDAPRVVATTESPSERWLLIRAMLGQIAFEVADRMSAISAVARRLREIHEIDPETCPFDRGLTTMVQHARMEMDRGLVNLSLLDAEHQGKPVETLWDDLMGAMPATEARVFCHGDYCLPNVLLTGQAVTGVLDWGRAGVSDPYRDLAIASRSIRDNFGPEYEAEFFSAYGIRNVDQARVGFYRLLDEFF